VLRALSGQSPGAQIAITRLDAELASDAVWLDLLAPTEEERAIAERATGLRLPTQSEVSEVEASSRLIQAGEVLTLSAPLIGMDLAGAPVVRPVGFVLSPRHLLTLRFAASTTVDDFAAHFHLHGEAAGMQPFLGLLEAIVDRMADRLEHEGAGLDGVSGRIFGAANSGISSQGRDTALRCALTEVGGSGDRVSQVRDGLLGLLRIVRFVTETAKAWTAPEETKRLAVLEKDLLSLNEYQSQLLGKVQFLLDATLGFISIEQNSLIKVLTVFSLVGIPPTLLAGIWGMNFKIIPELEWRYGYAFAWAMILLSAGLPLLWFKRKGWI
jgi:magnesium transporter